MHSTLAHTCRRRVEGPTNTRPRPPGLHRCRNCRNSWTLEGCRAGQGGRASHPHPRLQGGLNPLGGGQGSRDRGGWKLPGGGGAGVVGVRGSGAPGCSGRRGAQVLGEWGWQGRPGVGGGGSPVWVSGGGGAPRCSGERGGGNSECWGLPGCWEGGEAGTPRCG